MSSPPFMRSRLLRAMKTLDVRVDDEYPEFALWVMEQSDIKRMMEFADRLPPHPYVDSELPSGLLHRVVHNTQAVAGLDIESDNVHIVEAGKYRFTITLPEETIRAQYPQS